MRDEFFQQQKGMRRDQIQNETKIFTFPKGSYYSIRNLSNNLCMTVKKDDQSEKKNLTFQKHNNLDLSQIWMIEQVSEDNFQIIHAFSSMALQLIDSSVKLTANKVKNSQTFWLERSLSQIENLSQNVFTIKDFKNSKCNVFLDENDLIRCMQNLLWKDQYHKWKITPIQVHPLISQSCLIENYHSGLYLQIYQGKQSEGQKIVQNMLNNQFHQRWQIISKNESVIIRSLKTGFVLDIKGQRTKQGGSIIQYHCKDSPNQKWILQRHGNRIFIIRSVLDKSLMLSIKSNSIKDEAELTTSKNVNQSFWCIRGHIGF